MLLSYFIGQKKFPIHYDMKGIGLAVLMAAAAYVAYAAICRTGVSPILGMVFGTVLIAGYCAVMYVWLRRSSTRPRQA